MKLNYFSVGECNGYRIKIRSQLIGKILLNIILSVLQLFFTRLGGHICFGKKRKIGNREKHQWKHWKYPKKLGKQKMKHEETHGEMREACRELPLGGFPSQLVTSLPDSPANDCRICFMSKSVHNSPFFPWFSPTHGVLCKIYLNGGW